MRPKPIKNNKKECSRCNLWVKLSLFSKGKNSDGLRSTCKSCEKIYKISSRYNLSIEKSEEILKTRNCEICERKFTKRGTYKNKFRCVDHNHETGEFRGVLCNGCNAGIGYFEDNINNLNKAVKYLQKELEKDSVAKFSQYNKNNKK